MKPPASNWLLAPTPGPGEQPLRPDRGLIPRLERVGQRHRLKAFVLHVDLEVILQVLADAGKVEDDGDAERSRDVGRPDARALQQLREAIAPEHASTSARARGDGLAAPAR